MRFGGQTFRVKDEPSLRKLVASGKVPPDAQVQRPGGGPWLSLERALQPAAEPSADPWSAWADIDEDPQPRPRESARPAPRLSPVSSPTAPPTVLPTAIEPPAPAAPHGPPVASSERPGTPRRADPPRAEPLDGEPLPAEALGVEPLPPESLDGEPPTAELPSSPRGPAISEPIRPVPPPSRGKVIPFPGPRPGRREVDGPHALAPEPLPFPDRSPPPPPPPPELDLSALRSPRAARRARQPVERPSTGTHWWRIAFIAFLGVIGLSLARVYVQTVAGAEFGPQRQHLPPGLSEAQLAPPAPTPAPAPAPAEVDIEAAYREVEQTLRASLMAGTQPSATAGELETALFLELNRVRLSVIRVEIKPLAFRGDQDQGPLESAELRLVLRSDGRELDRELAAAALVVGKYVHADGLIVPVFEVAFDGLADGKALRTRLDANLARDFYTGRMRMGAFLKSLTR